MISFTSSPKETPMLTMKNDWFRSSINNPNLQVIFVVAGIIVRYGFESTSSTQLLENINLVISSELSKNFIYIVVFLEME